MPQLPKDKRFWLCSFLLWAATLWLLSSLSLNTGFDPPINHFDKVKHFGYFFGGSGFFCAWLYLRGPKPADWKSLIPTAILVLALIGWLDEWHQTFTPGRSGNDFFDWLADVSGAAAGAFTFKRFHHRLD